MPKIVYYSTITDTEVTTGEVLLVMDFAPDVDPAVYDTFKPDNTAWIEDAALDAFPETHYVNTTGTPAITARPQVYSVNEYKITPNGVDTVSFTIPAGSAMLDVNNNIRSVFASSEAFTFTTTIEGDWLYIFDFPFPNQDLTLRIHTYADD